MRVKERSANGEGVSKPCWYGNEGFNYEWIHYQIKAKDLFSVYVVFGYWYQGTPLTPVSFCVSLLTTSIKFCSLFANWDQHSEIDWHLILNHQPLVILYCCNWSVFVVLSHHVWYRQYWLSIQYLAWCKYYNSITSSSQSPLFSSIFSSGAPNSFFRICKDYIVQTVA